MGVFSCVDAEPVCIWDTGLEFWFFVPNVKPIGDPYLLEAVSDTELEFSFEVSLTEEPNVKLVAVDPKEGTWLFRVSEIGMWFLVSHVPNLKVTDVGVLVAIFSSGLLPNVKTGLLVDDASNEENADGFDVVPKFKQNYIRKKKIINSSKKHKFHRINKTT